MDQVYAEGLFDGEVVLITGGGTGIGLVSATEMGLLGAKVAICGRRPDPLKSAVAELESKGIEAFGAPCDIREPDAIAAYVDAVIERFGRIDVLINNAGLGGTANVVDMTDEQWQRVLDITLTGTFRMTRATLPHMIERGAGVIVNNASVLGWRAQVGQAH